MVSGNFYSNSNVTGINELVIYNANNLVSTNLLWIIRQSLQEISGLAQEQGSLERISGVIGRCAVLDWKTNIKTNYCLDILR